MPTKKPRDLQPGDVILVGDHPSLVGGRGPGVRATVTKVELSSRHSGAYVTFKSGARRWFDGDKEIQMAE